MRGKHRMSLEGSLDFRNIPAYAGKTHPRYTESLKGKEHPRVCGENQLFGRGLSQVRRNIPAYAGKTDRTAENSKQRSEHPRVCGENFFGEGWRIESFGTSPRMRGKLRLAKPLVMGRRNIPAYAGKTEFYGRRAGYEPEHPRVCGENDAAYASPYRHCGTSPRMRGKLQCWCGLVFGNRNIPAYAGKTTTTGENPAPFTEHPRVCGENTELNSGGDPVGGTSPRMRGKLIHLFLGALDGRNIPAYAGKT